MKDSRIIRAIITLTGTRLTMKLKYTILYVTNVADSLSFYEHAFGFKRRFLHEGGDYGELDTGSTTLSFSSIELMTNLGKSPAKANPGAPVFEIAFETDDVAGYLSRALEAGGRLVQDTKEEPWGQTTSYISDPNGFLVEICSSVG